MAVVELQIRQVVHLLGALARSIGLVGGFGRVHLGMRKRARRKDFRGAVNATIGGLQRHQNTTSTA